MGAKGLRERGEGAIPPGARLCHLSRADAGPCRTANRSSPGTSPEAPSPRPPCPGSASLPRSSHRNRPLQSYRPRSVARRAPRGTLRAPRTPLLSWSLSALPPSPAPRAFLRGHFHAAHRVSGAPEVPLLFVGSRKPPPPAPAPFPPALRGCNLDHRSPQPDADRTSLRRIASPGQPPVEPRGALTRRGRRATRAGARPGRRCGGSTHARRRSTVASLVQCSKQMRRWARLAARSRRRLAEGGGGGVGLARATGAEGSVKGRRLAIAVAYRARRDRIRAISHAYGRAGEVESRRVRAPTRILAGKRPRARPRSRRGERTGVEIARIPSDFKRPQKK